MNQRIFAPALFVLALLSLFLPYVRFEVFGWELFSMTGYELAFELDSVIFIQVFAVAALAGTAFSFVNSKSSSMLTTVSGAVGLISLGIYMVSIISDTPDLYTGSNLVLEYGFYLALLAVLTATLLSVVNLQLPSSTGSISPSRVVPGAGQLGGAPTQGWPYRPENVNYKQQVNPPIEPHGYYPQPSPAHHAVPPIGQSPTAASPHNVPQHYQNVATGLMAGYPKLIGISGQYAGQKIDLSSGPVTIGRDPGIANLVYRQTNKDVSRRHCTVSYDQNRQSFTIVDSSTNGTFLLPYERLIQGKQVQIESGARFFISDPSEQFEVRLE